MAKSQINTKSSSYMRDKDVFMKELRQFNESKNITLKPPIVNGIELDLYLFYSLVQQRGGIGKVNQTDVWESFLRPLRLPHPCINGSTLLRRIYGTHLERFERAKGPPGRDDDLEMEEELTKRGRGSHMPRIMFSGGTYISASGEALRTAQKPTATHSERLALSLLSPMPNEQDFAVNVCTVLAADHSNRLPLAATPHILDFLLAHAGVYNHPSLRDTIGRSYFEARGRYPDDFWKMRAGGGGARELADETKFTQSIDDEPELMVQAMAAHNHLTDCLTMDGKDDDVEKIAGDFDILEDWVTEPSEESQLFAPTLAGGAGCVYTQRVLQIASIVRSLSFHEENVQYLAKNNTLIRFLLLCSNCWVGTLRQSGFDTLGNVSTELIIKDPATCLISRHIISTIQSALVSPDRARVLAALELLNKLAQNELNEDALLKALESKVYADVCALLSLRDIMVLVCTLECVYALTSLGDRASEAVARVPGLIHTLVSLVTVEAQSYGPKACILMRVVETVSGPSALAAVAERETQPQPQTQPQLQSQAQAQSQPQTPQKQVPEQAASSPAAVPPAPTASTLQQSHLQQRTVQENEHFALAWLRSSYEPLPANDNSTYDSGELYKLYLTCCTKLNRKGVISPAHFPRLVRSVFGGTVGPNQVTLSSGETQQVYVGIRSRNQNRVNTQPGPASPILKAQLTNKPGGGEVKTPVSQPQTQQATPHLSSALESNPTNTTLIKHLLAHKVSPALPQLQVAQRQQNQQQGRSPNTVVVQPPTQAMNVDPEDMIKCTAITPCGVASITPALEKPANEDIIAPKEEPVQIQIDEQTQLTISNQNKMLADLLEKKSNPPVQVVQMTPQMGAPTIQITESGQIVQVKQEAPMIQISEAGLVSGGQFFQLKNDQGQLIQIKNDPGQLIQIKNDQGQIIHIKSDQLQQQIYQYKTDPMKPEPVPQLIQGVVQIKNEKDTVELLAADHSYTEPPSKKIKIDEKRESNAPQETASKTAANLYAALAASALEDEEDLLPPPAAKQETDNGQSENQSMIIQEPIMQVQQSNRQVQQAPMIQQPNLQIQGNSMQMQQAPHQVQQGMMQVQQMDVQNIIQSPSGQLILQDKSMGQQQQYMPQQQMQIIATPSNAQGGISYIAQNIPSNMMQKTIIIVQGPTGGGPLTLTVNNPGGLDEATLNSLIAQATEAITQQQIIQNAPQLTQSQQPVITTQPQPHKAQIMNQGQQQIVVTQKNPPPLISTATGNPISGQQIIVSNNQQIIMNAPLKAGGHKFTAIQPQRQTVLQSTDSKSAKSQPVVRQVITRQPIMVGSTKIGEKETIVSQPAVTERKAPSPSPHTPPLDDTPWICHWRGCGKSFENAGEVFNHAARVHCPHGAGGEAPCMWLDCDRVPRRTFALLNHLTDKHCSANALKAVYNSRRHAAAEAEANKPVSLGYPPNAALAALNKHAADMFNPRELMDENEGPVTKSIRLTAALILRNIVIYSNTGRRQLRSYESHLSSIAISSVEASRTIAQVLFDMNNI